MNTRRSTRIKAINDGESGKISDTLEDNGETALINTHKDKKATQDNAELVDNPSTSNDQECTKKPIITPKKRGRKPNLVVRISEDIESPVEPVKQATPKPKGKRGRKPNSSTIVPPFLTEAATFVAANSKTKPTYKEISSSESEEANVEDSDFEPPKCEEEIEPIDNDKDESEEAVSGSDAEQMDAEKGSRKYAPKQRKYIRKRNLRSAGNETLNLSTALFRAEKHGDYIYDKVTSKVKMRIEALGFEESVPKSNLDAYWEDVKKGKEWFSKTYLEDGLISLIEKHDASMNEWKKVDDCEYLEDLKQRKSVKVVIDPEVSESLKGEEECLKSLFFANNMSFDSKDSEKKSTVNMTFVGGPISNVRVCPFLFEEKFDLIAVSTFQNHDTLTDVGEEWMKNKLNGVQFYVCNPDLHDSLKLKFTLETNLGCINDFQFSNIRPKDANVLAYFAIAYSHGVVGIYSLPKSCSLFENVGYKVQQLHLLKHPNIVTGNGVSTNQVPYMKLAWSNFDKGDSLAVLSATKACHIWKLSENVNEPVISISDQDYGFATDVAFNSESEVCVSYYERIIVFFDLKTKEISYIEDRARTAGRRLTVESHILPHIFVFQPICTSYSEKTYFTTSSIFFEEETKTCICIPIYSKHLVTTNDISVCGKTGSIYSVGGDGRICINAQAVLDPYQFTTQRTFTLCKQILMLRRRAYETNEVSEGNDGDGTSKANITSEKCLKNVYLEIYTPSTSEEKLNSLNGSSMDIKIESLFRSCASQNAKTTAIYAGGEAGLLFSVSMNFEE
uniref:WD_REPEATS_REGION domain-containing protein n=1 Tax=Rhabditophanes sp. KR3021 TaxID=114890 RepID=A0AC35UAH2_9BILA